MEEPGTRSGLGQGCGCRGELAWGRATDSGGRADSHWSTRRVGAWEAPVLPNQTRFHVPMRGKASLLTPGCGEGKCSINCKSANTSRTGGLCFKNPKLPEGFQQSNFKGQVREGGRRVCDQLVHNSLADGEVTGPLTL